MLEHQVCSCGTWCVCSSQISSAVPHANTEPMLGSTLPCKSLGEAWEAGTMWSGILEVSKENMGEVERMKTVMGWNLTTWVKVNVFILGQLRVLHPSLADGPVLFQVSLYSTHSLLTREGGEFSSKHLNWRGQLEADSMEKGKQTLNWSATSLDDGNNIICSFNSEALQRAVSHQHPNLSLWP